jgi:purine-cytosine permease-like protein
MKKNLTNWLAIAFLGTASVLWPFWLVNGYFDEWYPLIGSFIAIYGGLTANIIFVIKNKKK